jgi:hypothetical protein
MRIGKIIRAFFTALRMTVRGETLAAPDQTLASAYPTLDAWRRETLRLVLEIESTAKREALDLHAMRVNVDKRSMTVETILAAVRYHAGQEYAFMLRQNNRHTLLGIVAINVNDQHLLAAWMANAPPALYAALAALAAHLSAVPHEQPVAAG